MGLLLQEHKPMRTVFAYFLIREYSLKFSFKDLQLSISLQMNKIGIHVHHAYVNLHMYPTHENVLMIPFTAKQINLHIFQYDMSYLVNQCTFRCSSI